ncbi:MAG: M28 family peptidase [Candidatus Omnitrophica bacterium]|nr:M28 family peptidase [Candidatus Omnitrophota bacterium]
MIGLFDPIIRSISAETIREHVQHIWEKNRFFDFTRFRETADYIEECLKNYGLEVDRIDLPADGETRFGDAVMPLAWDCETAEISIVSPAQRILANRSDCPNCVGMWSPPTSPEGIEASVFCLASGEPGELENQNVKGMFIYTPGRIDAIRELAVKQEAAGVISSWTPAAKNRDSVQWIFRNSDIPGGWGPSKNASPLLCLAVSPKCGDEIIQMASEGTVTLCVKVQSRLYSGELPLISGLIPGDPGEEEILLNTPIYGQGAHFNASTTAAMLESARVLANQIDGGVMPKPWRGIRFLFSPKLYGSIAFARSRKPVIDRTLFALNLESGAGNPDISWSRWSYRYAPVCRRHYSDGLAWKIFHLYLQHWRPQRFLETPSASLSSDIVFNDPQIGVPTHWLYGGTDDECRHSSADVIDSIDSRSLIDLAAAPLAMAYTMACIGNGDIPDLAVWNYNVSQERFQNDLQIFLDRAKEARNLSDLNELLGDASRHFDLRVQTEADALRSLSELGEDVEQQLDWETVTELISGIEELGKSARNVIRAHANVRADEMNLPLTKLETAADPVEDDRIPVRIGEALGVITLDSIPFEEWSTPVKTSPRNNLPFILAWWLVDGKRTIGQIQRLLHFDVTRYRECIPAWFTFLEKHGYITIKGEKEADSSGAAIQEAPEIKEEPAESEEAKESDAANEAASAEQESTDSETTDDESETKETPS